MSFIWLELRFVDGIHGFHCLQLTDDKVFNQNIQSQPLGEGDAIVDDGHYYLAAEGGTRFASSWQKQTS